VADEYLLAGRGEVDRLQLQARVWEPETESMLDRIGVQPGWNCLDVGCGAMGILSPLSRRVGSSSFVVGIDGDAQQLAAARAFIRESGLTNVEILKRDAYRTGLPRGSFDFVHVRFVFAPAGRNDELLNEVVALTRPGGMVAIQEPDAGSWAYYPPFPAWVRLKQAIVAAFAQGGGDFNAGQRTYQLLLGAGLQDVRVRAAVLALQDRHPYLRLPVQFATSLRTRLVRTGLMSDQELGEALAECEQTADAPETVGLTFTVIQVWGQKPAG